MGAQPLKRHDQFLAFFFSVKVETLLPGFPDGLAIGVTASTPDEIKTDIAAVGGDDGRPSIYVNQGKPLAKSAEDVLDTFIVGLRGRMYSPFWEHKSRHCEWSGTLENGLQGGSVVRSLVYS
ncbi:hypothetical protein Pmar_PMAR000779 [Perkinsus marinus ATCC 50983]|uniref:Uncharacterized protein n=1 Tax=Perkinsus marinus (strain ATCC 50983 / TXsc) TaxID=423536 RepID=C5KXL0_PERM5|nr:hypothetical protein Pmar_PMAR000779 [Perkinsus marinus ATCC 50983]EER10734.1 hypothetical protein Pmar_PMAR000779 [Perkinsus marinus ATCC 50983]|eukprot:XP_002778939.1 hypothetical protein Pmar_PMAR000779 [Perkinsus marinus ATCC 50983]